MLDPELLDQLAAHPEQNAPDVNLALAEQGHGSVLLALCRSNALARDALALIDQRIREEQGALAQPPEAWDEPATLLRQLDEALIAHPASSVDTRDQVLARHPGEPFFVLAAAAHPGATLTALECAADWPARFAVLERLWLQLIPRTALPPLVAEAWSQSELRGRRELVARLSGEHVLLAALALDPAREVRRAVASNRAAGVLRQQLAQADPAPEVRARAAATLGEHEASGSVRVIDSARFAAALRAMSNGGVLTADVATALATANERLDEEGAMLAARVLPQPAMLELVEQLAHLGVGAAPCRGLAAGLALRAPQDGEGDLRELVADSAKALSAAAEHYGLLTGKARLAAWFSDGIANCQCLSPEPLVGALCHSSAALGPVLKRAFEGDRILSLCRNAMHAEQVPGALVELAWECAALADEEVIELANRLAKTPRRGRDLADDEIDLDPSRRSLATLEKVVLAISRKATLSPRTALAVVAMDSRRVRYVLTALPQWRSRLSGSLLGRVLKQRAGALSAGRSEARARGSENKAWTQRILSDAELAVALAIGHITPDLVAKLLHSGRHVPKDGVGLAHGADTRATLAGREAIAPMLHWAQHKRRDEPVALTLWLLLEGHDRPRTGGMIASSIDSLAVAGKITDANVADALATMERRTPGRLEKLTPQTPRGKSALAAAVARAYRALGGLRDER